MKCNICYVALIHIQKGTRDILNNSLDVCWLFICHYTAVYLCSSYISIVNSTQSILQFFILCVVVNFTEQIHFQWHICNINMISLANIVAEKVWTTKWRAAIQPQFLYFNLCQGVKLDNLSCSFTPITFLTNMVLENFCHLNLLKQKTYFPMLKP